MTIFFETVKILYVQLDSKSYSQRVIMGDDIVQAEFTLDYYVDIPLKSMIIYDGHAYWVNTLPDISKKSNKEYTYSITFEHPKYFLSNIIFKTDDTDTDFYLNADAEQIQSTIVDLMNDQGLGYWAAGTVSVTDYVDFDFEDENCLEVLNRVCEEFDVEYEIVSSGGVNTINIRDFVGVDKNIDLSYKKGLYSFTRTLVDERNITTRLFAKGGSTNIPDDYDSDSITIDPLELNIDEKGVSEKVFVDETIYPKFEGTVDSCSGSIFTDSDIDFNLNDQLVSGVTAKVNFTSGLLAGYEFEVEEFDNSLKQITLVDLISDIGETLPNEASYIAVDDTFTFTDIYMPDSYVETAESDLYDLALSYITKYNSPIQLFDVTVDARYLRENSIELEIGDKINIVDSQMSIDDEMRIYSIKKSIVDKYSYQLELTNDLKTSKLSDITKNQYSIDRTISKLKEQIQILKNN